MEETGLAYLVKILTPFLYQRPEEVSQELDRWSASLTIKHSKPLLTSSGVPQWLNWLAKFWRLRAKKIFMSQRKSNSSGSSAQKYLRSQTSPNLNRRFKILESFSSQSCKSTRIGMKKQNTRTWSEPSWQSLFRTSPFFLMFWRPTAKIRPSNLKCCIASKPFSEFTRPLSQGQRFMSRSRTLSPSSLSPSLRSTYWSIYKSTRWKSSSLIAVKWILIRLGASQLLQSPEKAAYHCSWAGRRSTDETAAWINTSNYERTSQQ